MTPAKQLRFWLIGLGLFVLALWLLADMLLPFVVGLAIAYLLDPAVDRLEAAGLPRWLGTTLVLLGFVLVMVLMALLLLPLVQGQVSHLLEVLPSYATLAKERLIPALNRFIHRLPADDVERLRAAAGNYAGELAGLVGRIVTRILSGGLALFDIVTLMFITPVVPSI